jgi:hypothetical protein
MNLTIAEILDGGELQPAWVEYPGIPGSRFQLQHFNAAEQRRRFASKSGRPLTDNTRTQAWLDHVLDWDVKTPAGHSVPFSAARLRTLWDLDAAFNAWLVEECQRLENFLREPGPAPAGDAPVDQPA